MFVCYSFVSNEIWPTFVCGPRPNSYNRVKINIDENNRDGEQKDEEASDLLNIYGVLVKIRLIILHSFSLQVQEYHPAMDWLSSFWHVVW